MIRQPRSSPASALKAILCTLQVEAAVTFLLTHSDTITVNGRFIPTFARPKPPFGAGWTFQHAGLAACSAAKKGQLLRAPQCCSEKDRKSTNKGQHGAELAFWGPSLHERSCDWWANGRSLSLMQIRAVGEGRETRRSFHVAWRNCREFVIGVFWIFFFSSRTFVCFYELFQQL